MLFTFVTLLGFNFPTWAQTSPCVGFPVDSGQIPMTVSYVNATQTPVTSPAVNIPPSYYPTDVWPNPIPGTTWIGITITGMDDGAVTTYYTYTGTFQAASTAASYEIEASADDNVVTILVNECSLPVSESDFSKPYTGNLPIPSTCLNTSGPNTLAVVVVDTELMYTGLDFSIICSAFTPTLSPTPTKTQTPTNTPTVTMTPSATATFTPTSSSTATFTPTPTLTPSPTYTLTPTYSPTDSPTITVTPTFTDTDTSTFTITDTFTPTVTNTATETPTETLTHTYTSTPTPTSSFTTTSTMTVTPTYTVTPTFTASNTFTATLTETFTVTPTSTNTDTNTFTVTPTPSWTATVTDTFTFTSTPTPTATVTATSSFTATNTHTFTSTATPTPTYTTTFTRTWTSTRTVTPTPSQTRTPTTTMTPTVTHTITATRTITNTPTVTLTYTHTQTHTLTSTPTQTHTPTATTTPSVSRTITATRTFTRTPTVTLTFTHTQTHTITQTHTSSYTPTRTLTRTVTATPTYTRTLTLSPTLRWTSTVTLTHTTTSTSTPLFTPTPLSGCGTSSVNLQLREYTTCGNNQSQENFELFNNGTTALNLAQISVKFWVYDTTGQPVVGAVNYGGYYGPTNTGVAGVAITGANFSPACGPDGTNLANWEMTLSNSDGGQLAAGSSWSNIQTAIHLANYGNFSNTSVWYSPCGLGSNTNYVNSLYYAVYYQGNLVTASGGVPPSCRPIPTCTVPTATVTNTPTMTYSPTVSSTVTKTPTPTVTFTPSITASFTQTPTVTLSPTITLSPTVTSTKTNTATMTNTHTSTVTLTPTFTGTWTLSPTITLSLTMTLSPTSTGTATQTSTFTWSKTITPTPTITLTPTWTLSPTTSFTKTLTPTWSVTLTPTSTHTDTTTLTATSTRTHTLTPTITLTRTQTYTPTHTLTSTITPTRTQTKTPTSTATTTPRCGISLAGLQLEEKTTCGTNQANQSFEVINTGSTGINLNQITIKFWVDDTNITGNPANTVIGAVNWGGNYGTTGIAVSGVAISTINFFPPCGPDATHQANWEITVSNTDAAVLPAGATWSDIQTAIHVGPDYVNFVPGTADWYSPCGVGGGSIYTNDLHYAVYYQGNLVSASGGIAPACRPVPACVSNTPTVTDTRTTTETPTETATRTVTYTPTLTRTRTFTVTPTTTHSVTNTPTVTLTPNVTLTPTNTITYTVTDTPSITVTATVTSTATNSFTLTVTSTGTLTSTPCTGYQLINTFTMPGSGIAPLDVAVDPTLNYVYIAASIPGGTQLTRWKYPLGSIATAGWTVNMTSTGSLHLAVDNNGNIFVANEAANEVQEYFSNGVPGPVWGPAIGALGQFNKPWGIATDPSGNVYVSDSGNNRVVKLTASTGYAPSVIIQGYGTSNPGDFSNPQGLAVDSAGNIYVGDSANKRWEKFLYSGQFSYPVGGLAPRLADIVVDACGNVYVDDAFDNSIGIYNSSGHNFTSIIPTGLFQMPIVSGLGMDTQNNLYVPLTNGQVQIYAPCTVCQASTTPFVPLTQVPTATQPVLPTATLTPTGTVCAEFQPLAEFGQDLATSIGTGPGNLSTALDTVVDSQGYIYTSDNYGQYIFKYDPYYNFIGIGTWSTDSSSARLALDGSGHLWETMNNEILEFNTSNLQVTSYSLPSGSSNAWGIAVTFSSAGTTVCVVSGGSILGFNPSSSTWSTIVSGGGVNSFFNATGLAIDGSGDFYVADQYLDRVQKYNQGSGTWSTIVSNSTSNVQTGGVINDLAVDSNGQLYVDDSTNDRVLVFDCNGNYLSNATISWTTGGVVYGLGVDPNNNIYLTQSYDVLVYSPGSCIGGCGTSSLISKAAKAILRSKDALSFTPTPSLTTTTTPMPTVNPELLTQSVVAAPNISKNGEPVDLRVTLGHPGQVRLSVYNLVGEMVYQTTVEGTTGVNDLLWQVENQAHTPVASGLYIYILQVDDTKIRQNYTGKIAVIR